MNIVEAIMVFLCPPFTLYVGEVSLWFEARSVHECV